MKYFIGFMITIGLFILLIFMLFSGGGDKPKVPTTAKTLDSYASTDAETIMIADAPINAAGEHQQIRITVARNEVTYEEIKGYNGDVTEQKHFANTESAYAAFLLALAHAGFTQGNVDKALRDERGYCPLGNRYIFELSQGSQSIQRFWATSCGNPKTYGGDLSTALALFRAQVPNYNDLSDNIAL